MFITHLAAPGLNCGVPDLLLSSLQHAEYLAVACGIFRCGMRTLGCGMWDPVPQPWIEPGPPEWKRGVLATGSPGKSLKLYF